MKKELKRKYLPFHYRQDIFLKIQNLKQQNLTVEEYSAEFENLMIYAILICLVPVPVLWAVFLCPGCGLVLSMVVMLGNPVCGV